MTRLKKIRQNKKSLAMASVHFLYPFGSVVLLGFDSRITTRRYPSLFNKERPTTARSKASFPTLAANTQPVSPHTSLPGLRCCHCLAMVRFCRGMLALQGVGHIVPDRLGAPWNCSAASSGSRALHYHSAGWLVGWLSISFLFFLFTCEPFNLARLNQHCSQVLTDASLHFESFVVSLG